MVQVEYVLLKIKSNTVIVGLPSSTDLHSALMLGKWIDVYRPHLVLSSPKGIFFFPYIIGMDNNDPAMMDSKKISVYTNPSEQIKNLFDEYLSLTKDIDQYEKNKREAQNYVPASTKNVILN